MRQTPLMRILERLGDLAIVGLLTVACSVPVVTALAAFSAAVAVLATPDAAGPIAVRFARTFRQQLAPTLKVQAVLLAAWTVGLGDIVAATRWLADGGAPWWQVGPVLAAGTLLAGTAAVLPPYTAALPVMLAGARPQMRAVIAMAYGRPRTTAMLVAIAVLMAAVVAVVPILAPLLVALYAQTSYRIIAASVRRLTRGAGTDPKDAGSTERTAATHGGSLAHA